MSTAEVKGSKQKIFQLREELNAVKTGNVNQSIISANPSIDKLGILRQAYETSKSRAEEVLSSTDLNYYLKMHGHRANKLYSALTTLIYSSISISKADELENFIKKAATQVPSNLFDLNEWSDILVIAKEARTVESTATHNEIENLKKNSALLYFLVQNPLQTTKAEIKLLKNEVTAALTIMQTDLANGKSLINFLVTRLKDICSASNLDRLQQENRDLRTTYGNEYDKMQAFIDALVTKHKEVTDVKTEETRLETGRLTGIITGQARDIDSLNADLLESTANTERTMKAMGDQAVAHTEAVAALEQKHAEEKAKMEQQYTEELQSQTNKYTQEMQAAMKEMEDLQQKMKDDSETAAQEMKDVLGREEAANTANSATIANQTATIASLEAQLLETKETLQDQIDQFGAMEKSLSEQLTEQRSLVSSTASKLTKAIGSNLELVNELAALKKEWEETKERLQTQLAEAEAKGQEQGERLAVVEPMVKECKFRY